MTDGEILDALGGTSKVAAAISEIPQVVSNWRKRGISKAGRYQIQILAKQMQFSLPDDFLTRAASP